MKTLKKDTKIIPPVILAIAVTMMIAAIIFIGTHIFTFSGSGLSKDPDKWGVFGDFYNASFSLINLAITGLLTFAVFRLQRKRDEWEQNQKDWEKAYLIIQETPSLIFASHNGESYRLYNVGKGTANNVIFANWEMDKKDINKPVKAYSIPPNCYLETEKWTTSANKLFVYYESIAIAGETPKTFLTKCDGDQNIQIEDEDMVEILKGRADREIGIKLKHL